ncbi:MAG: hypothetical protein DI535_16540 [Citrobacter freundii]|nr:MAG: hypothetical protein DI535_16540 [Citrobacter freundii]
MKNFLLLFGIMICSVGASSQKIVLVKDSIMNAYMKSGFATKNFRPDGHMDNEYMRQGQWKDYEVMEFGAYQLNEKAPLKTTGMYLVFGEGEFINSKRTGPWRMYVIEDKTFRKILSQTLTYQAGKAEGPFTYYYPDGKIAQSGVYKAGKIEGPASIFYPDGTIFGNQLFIADKKDGRQEYFYPDGKLNFFYTYVNGIREGAYESYYPNGQPKEFYHLVGDSLNGIYRYYYPSGQLWTEKEYKNGLTWNITGTYDKAIPSHNSTSINTNHSLNLSGNS